jgi:hypothetical protein
VNIIATQYRRLADAADVQAAAIIRQRDTWRALADLFDPPPLHPPLPTIVPPPTGPDPDYDDAPGGEETGQVP